MAYAQHRTTSGGTSRWYAIYYTPDGVQRIGGGFSTKRDAERAAIKLEQQAAGGSRHARRRLARQAHLRRLHREVLLAGGAAPGIDDAGRIPIESGQSLPAALRAAAYEQDRRIDGAGMGQ